MALYKSPAIGIIESETAEERKCFGVDIGKRIAELRTASGMSQQALADALFVSRDLVSKWESGMRRPDYRTIERIAEVFRISADSIVEKKDLVFEELSDCFPDDPGIPEEQLIAVLNDFLRKSKAKNADVFLKRYYFQKSVTEIAGEYGIGENHVRSSLSKMRKKLKTEFSKEV